MEKHNMRRQGDRALGNCSLLEYIKEKLCLTKVRKNLYVSLSICALKFHINTLTAKGI